MAGIDAVVIAKKDPVVLSARVATPCRDPRDTLSRPVSRLVHIKRLVLIRMFLGE